MENSSPLQWPVGVPRTNSPGFSSFDRKRSMEQARQILFNELRRLGAQQIVFSSNLCYRQDGFPYSNQRQPDDKGVAVYFSLKRRRYCMPCDRWNRCECNVYAIAKHIQAMRGQDRWGVGSVEQAFAGYAALPAPQRSWRDVFGVDDSHCSAEVLKMLYRKLATRHHPDNGGSDAAMAELNQAYADAKKELGL